MLSLLTCSVFLVISIFVCAFLLLLYFCGIYTFVIVVSFADIFYSFGIFYGGTEVTCVCIYLSRAHDKLSRAHDIIKFRARPIRKSIFYYILMQNADTSVPKYTYTVGYWHISTIISVHISEQQHFYCLYPISWRQSYNNQVLLSALIFTN